MEIEVVFSRTTPPYVIQEHDRGISIDIVTQAMQTQGYSVQPVYVNIARGVEMFKSGLVDANALVQEGMGMQAYYSDPFITYHNAIFTRKDSGLELEKLEDVIDIRSVAFQKAKIYLGKEFKKVAKKAKSNYSEQPDQKLQVAMLLLGRIDAAIMDVNIFHYYKALLEDEGLVAKDLQIVQHDFFQPTQYQVAFTKPSLKQDFNSGLAKIQADGTYDAIIARYR